MPLTDREKSVAKNLLNSKRMSMQDIANLISMGRDETINIARISEVKKDNNIAPESDEDVERFIKEQKATDLNTGLNPYKHERIIRSREAMILAVHLYNNPAIKFKSEFFSVLAISAWSYLLVEYCARNKIKHENNDKNYPLKQLLGKVPLDRAIRKNINYVNDTRNSVSHGQEIADLDSDSEQFEYYLACCVNYNDTIKSLLDERYGLEEELSIALQFSKFDIQRQIESTRNYDLPETILKLREEESKLGEEIMDNEKYKYRPVIVSERAAQNIYYNIVSEDNSSTLNKDVININAKNAKDIVDGEYQYFAKEVVKNVADKTGKKFEQHHHTFAWKKYKARPDKSAKGDDKDKTKTEWCAHIMDSRYKFTQKWIDFLVEKVEAGEEFR